MATGLHGWYVMRRITAEAAIKRGCDVGLAHALGGSWYYCNFKVGEDLLPTYHLDQYEGTPFKTRERAELVAFDLTSREPDLMHNVKVELR